MKKKVFLMLFSLLSISAFSQVSYLIKGGVNMSNFTGVDNNTNMRLGYQVGVGIDYALDGTWSLLPSLLIISKGAKIDIPGATLTFNPVYVELPVMIAARVNVINDVNVVFSAGPYFAYGVWGKVSANAFGIFSEDVNFFGSKKKVDLNSNRFDVGMGVGAGLELSHVLIGLNAELGMMRLKKRSLIESVTGSSPRNVDFSITVGYKF